MRTILFHRKYRRFHGGHLKVWHYFNHAMATPGFDARILFDAGSAWDSSNPWASARERVVDSVDAVRPDLLFVAGRDWQRMDALGLLDRGLPIVNLIQHLRHADDWSIQSRYLKRKAIRVCVSAEVAKAVTAAGSHGATLVIPNGIDVPVLGRGMTAERPTDLLIAGLKQPGMAGRVGRRLQEPGRSIEVLTEYLDREAFLDAMRRARVTLFLPNREEGFYLPALEGMALGTIVVCPDCVGNRSFCVPEQNAFRPDYTIDSIIQATESALSLSPEGAMCLRTRALETARAHSPESERKTFASLLQRLDDVWADG